VARRQLDAEVEQSKPKPTDDVPAPAELAENGAPEVRTPAPSAPRVLRRFRGGVHLDPMRVGRDAGRIAEEVIAHLAGQPGVKMTILLKIDAQLPDGASEQTLRTVTENCRTLKFESHTFESE